MFVGKKTLIALFTLFTAELASCAKLDAKPLDSGKLKVGEGVKQYTGYSHDDEKDKHLFFWLFQSQNDPKSDPLVMWLNGGPGCSSMDGLLFENGPSLINSDIKPHTNNYSWNKNASVLYLDQPVNTGFSYSSKDVDNSRDAAHDVHDFLEAFFKEFPEYKDVKFHIAGESYAGHYIPAISEVILEKNSDTFKLESVAIGNGAIDNIRQYDKYEPMACGDGGVHPLISDSSCSHMNQSWPKCKSMIENCRDGNEVQTCVNASDYCDDFAYDAVQKAGYNFYNVEHQCTTQNGNCYIEDTYVEKFLNKDDVQKALGTLNKKYKVCNDSVGNSFSSYGDSPRDYSQSLGKLLGKNIPVLIYAGDKDFICNWLGNMAVAKAIEWDDKDKFNKVSFKDWKIKNSDSDKTAGQVLNHKHLSFLRIYDSGHMVPYDQPESGLDMINRWISGDHAFGN